jgi:VanZ family protein
MGKNSIRPVRIQWAGQPLPLARLCAFGFFLLISYASLTPFEFVFDLPVSPLDWALAPLPKYITLFDVMANILGYMPFGFLAVFALFPKYEKWRALLVTLILGMLLSGLLESMQIWLPSRISSNLDWWANVIGTLIGGLFALPFKPNWFSGGALDQYRFAWFGERFSFFILFLLLPWAQIYPQNAWLVIGDLGIDQFRVSQFWNLPIGNASQELLMTALATLSIGSFFMFGMNPKGPKLRLLAGLLIATALLKLCSVWLQVGLDHALDWVTISAILGMFVGGSLLIWVTSFNKVSQWWLAFGGLMAMLVLVNIMPVSPYHDQEIALLPKGRLTHFNGLLEWVTWIWPTLAIYNLLRIGFKNSSKTTSNQ